MTLPAGFMWRGATLADAETIQAQRDAMYTDMGRAPEQVREASAASLEWLRGALESGAYSGLLLETEAQVVAGAGIIWQDLPPSPRSLITTRAYVLNVYVKPEQRGKGLARQLVQALLTECAVRKVEYVSLHASEAGRRTYEKLGFTNTNEMRLILEAR